MLISQYSYLTRSGSWQHILRSMRERARRETMRVGEAERDNQTLHQCQSSRKRFSPICFLGDMHTTGAQRWSSAAGVRGRGTWVSLCGEREREKVSTRGPRRRQSLGGRRRWRSEGLHHLADLGEHFFRRPLGVDLWTGRHGEAFQKTSASQRAVEDISLLHCCLTADWWPPYLLWHLKTLSLSHTLSTWCGI